MPPPTMATCKDASAVRAYLDEGGDVNAVLTQDAVLMFLRLELVKLALWSAGFFVLLLPFFVRPAMAVVGGFWVLPGVFFAWKDGTVLGGAGARALYRMGAGITLLMAACYWKQGEQAALLLVQRGANVHARTAKDRTAADLARAHGCFSRETVARLVGKAA